MRATIKTWILATRPPSLFITVVPVVMGIVLAYSDGIEHWPSAFMALAGGLLIHIGTNLTNDYCDLQKGADHVDDEMKMTRVIPLGAINPETLKKASIISFLLAVIPCIYLIQRAGWPIVIIALLSMLSGIFYTAGKKPLGYLGFGDLLVIFFFGPIAVSGTYYVQSFEINTSVILAGIAPGLLSVAILVVNNIRDIDRDRSVGKKTLAVRFGKTFAFGEYLFCIIGASLIPVLIYAVTNDHFQSLIAVVTALFAIPTMISVLTEQNEASLNVALESTLKLLITYGILFCVGWIM